MTYNQIKTINFVLKNILTIVNFSFSILNISVTLFLQILNNCKQKFYKFFCLVLMNFLFIKFPMLNCKESKKNIYIIYVISNKKATLVYFILKCFFFFLSINKRYLTLLTVNLFNEFHLYRLSNIRTAKIY